MQLNLNMILMTAIICVTICFLAWIGTKGNSKTKSKDGKQLQAKNIEE